MIDGANSCVFPPGPIWNAVVAAQVSFSIIIPNGVFRQNWRLTLHTPRNLQHSFGLARVLKHSAQVKCKFKTIGSCKFYNWCTLLSCDTDRRCAQSQSSWYVNALAWKARILHWMGLCPGMSLQYWREYWRFSILRALTVTWNRYLDIKICADSTWSFNAIRMVLLSNKLYRKQSFHLPWRRRRKTLG